MIARARVSRKRTVCALFTLFLVFGCRGDLAPQRHVDESLAERLAGTWDLMLQLERPMSLSTDSRRLPLSVRGTVVLLEVRTGQLTFEQMKGATHAGVYEIDLGAMGLPALDAGTIPGVAARRVTNGAEAPGGRGHDSVFMVINPESPRHVLRLTGTFEGDSVSGVWVAESFFGGGGRFALRRHAASSAPIR